MEFVFSPTIVLLSVCALAVVLSVPTLRSTCQTLITTIALILFSNERLRTVVLTIGM